MFKKLTEKLVMNLINLSYNYDMDKDDFHYYLLIYPFQTMRIQLNVDVRQYDHTNEILQFNLCSGEEDIEPHIL